MCRSLVKIGAGAVVALGLVGASASAEERSLTLYNAHTKENATIVYKRDGRFVQSGVKELDYFMRDWRRNEPTKMDPQLYDILWEVYRQTGARQPITVICGYRSRETNDMLRRRGRGVARNSLHVKGQAIDFFIPGVDLAKMRAIGMRMQAGGVGFYPSSGSPFIHMDTGAVRHWPKMSRRQLVKVFPEGKTLHVPSDGKALPGYAQALAAYKMRKARGIAVAKTGVVPPVAVAAAEMPLPRLAPLRDLPSVLIAAAETQAEEPVETDGTLLAYPPKAEPVDRRGRFSDNLFAKAPPAQPSTTVQVAFDTAYGAQTGAPVDLIAALVKRYGSAQPTPVSASRTASLPIRPTAVVSTVDVDLSRPLRADAITTAVLSGDGDRIDDTVPPVLAYASATAEPQDAEPVDRLTVSGVPLPQTNPIRNVEAKPAPVLVQPVRTARDDALFPADLTLTKLDTQSLRLWIAAPSTREKRYALLTVPAFDRTPELFATPQAALATGFRNLGDQLRTDRFDRSAVSPLVVDLNGPRVLASR
ncbi:DUF882 domain-containing protein [Bauldia sp.]|uniref:DUF882 domain-containing protein n=1 Tax=Bauldia sp. TaxID=2575872 RepID=UPI003BAC6B20